MKVYKINWDAIFGITKAILGLGVLAFWALAFWLMCVRENGTHEQRVNHFGEDAALRMEAENEKRRQKCK